MNTALMVDKLHTKGCRFILTHSNKDLHATQKAVQAHHKAVAEGIQRKVILMAIQHDVLPEYTILVVAKHPNEKELEQFGFYPVKKDNANWIPIQYRNREGKEHIKSRDGDYNHTTNLTYLPIDEVHQYIKLVEKQEQINLIYK